MSAASRASPRAISSARRMPGNRPADSGGVSNHPSRRMKILLRRAFGQFSALVAEQHLVASGRAFAVIKFAPAGLVAQQLVAALGTFRRNPVASNAADWAAKHAPQPGIDRTHPGSAARATRPLRPLQRLQRGQGALSSNEKPSAPADARHPRQMLPQPHKSALVTQGLDQYQRLAAGLEKPRLEQAFGIFGCSARESCTTPPPIPSSPRPPFNGRACGWRH